MVILRPITKKLKENSKRHKFAFEFTSREAMHDFINELLEKNISVLDFRFTNHATEKVIAEIEVEFVKRAEYNPFLVKLTMREDVIGFKKGDFLEIAEEHLW